MRDIFGNEYRTYHGSGLVKLSVYDHSVLNGMLIIVAPIYDPVKPPLI